MINENTSEKITRILVTAGNMRPDVKSLSKGPYITDSTKHSVPGVDTTGYSLATLSDPNTPTSIERKAERNPHRMY